MGEEETFESCGKDSFSRRHLLQTTVSKSMPASTRKILQYGSVEKHFFQYVGLRRAFFLPCLVLCCVVCDDYPTHLPRDWFIFSSAVSTSPTRVVSSSEKKMWYKEKGSRLKVVNRLHRSRAIKMLKLKKKEREKSATYVLQNSGGSRISFETRKLFRMQLQFWKECT